jgi:O-antigen/teichoic acid export membrane protein
MVRSTLGMFIILGAGGIGVTATRYIAAFRKEQQAHAASIYRMSFIFSLVLGIAITVIALATSQILSVDYLKAPELTNPLLIGSVILLLSILNSSENGTLAGLEDFKSIAINTLIGSFFEAVCMVAGAYLYQLEGAVAGFAIGVLCLYIANKLSAIKALGKEGISAYGETVFKKDWALILSYSIPATLSALTVTPVFWLVRSMLVRASNYSELGIFEAADQWKVILLFIPGAISQIVLPILASITSNKEFKNTLLANIIGISCISLLFAIFTLLASNMIMNFYGNGFEDTTPLVLLGFSTVFSSVSNVIEMSVYSKDKIWTSFFLNLIWAIVLILSTYYLLRMGYGASAPALAVFISYVAKTLMIWIYIKTILKTYDHQ